MTTFFNRRRRNVIKTRSFPSAGATWTVVVIVVIAMSVLAVHVIARAA